MRHFKRIYIEITNVCNLDCRFCPKTSRNPEFMSRELFTRILGEVKGYTEHLYFHVMGEPLLHPDIGSFLDECGGKGFKVNLTTNGTLIRERKDRLLSKDALRAVNFSLHIFDKNEARGAVDAYLRGIFDFISDLEASGTIICLRLWNMERPVSFLEGKSSGMNSYMIKRIEEFFAVQAAIEEVPSEGNGVKLRDNVYLSQRSFFDWPDMNSSEVPGKAFCLGLRQQVAILVDGTVTPCCLDSEGTIDLGNIKEKSFKEIIEGKRAMNIYRGFSERMAVEPLCRKCGYRKRFGER